MENKNLWVKYDTKMRQQNALYILKIKFGNGQGDHVLVVSALKLFPFKNIHI